ncbi:nucleoside/nucleotide kinase family protein [Vibrio algicola]|uniref:Nucleoside/nucleotide kinase family protein n=1 Tax=Vibrio algicola TaxID=2662262 RepID=A0A5Q0TIE6_9VIBR|nr:nucleoside/nucleotide kinase family protein [Vibrio algicola]
MKVNLNVSGFDTEAVFFDEDIVKVHQPLVEKFTRLYQENEQRIVIFLCAPPGSGKSTLAAFWQHLSNQNPSIEPLQVLPFDGFHLPNAILEESTIHKNGKDINLKNIKGSYETFNLISLIDKLKQLKNKEPKWPYYDRNIHDPVDDAIQVNQNIVVVEGNWLLLDEPVWNELHHLADFSIFIDTEPKFLQERLVNRKIRGGSSEADALAFYHNSDAINVEKVLQHSVDADLKLFMNRNGSFDIC